MAQALEGRVGLRLGEELLPEQRAGNELEHPLALEQVKHHHHRQREAEEEGGRLEKVHRWCCGLAGVVIERAWAKPSAPTETRVFCFVPTGAN